MSEKEEEFWLELRFKISRSDVFDAYCDWIEPKVYYFLSPNSIVEGKIGFLTPKMEVYKFKLTIPVQFDYLVDKEWVTLKEFELDPDKLDIFGDTLEIHLLEN